MLLNLLLVIEIIVSVVLVGVVLLQRSEGGVLGQGGSPGGFMTARGAGDLMTRITWILGATFFILALALTLLAGRERGASSVLNRLKVDAIDPTTLNTPPAQQAPAQPTGPAQTPPGQVHNPFLDQAPVVPAPAPAQAPPAK